MAMLKASNLEQAKQLLQSDDTVKIELDFELDSDEFFNFAIEYCTHGAKLTRVGDRFVVCVLTSCHSQRHRGRRLMYL